MSDILDVKILCDVSILIDYLCNGLAPQILKYLIELSLKILF